MRRISGITLLTALILSAPATPQNGDPGPSTEPTEAMLRDGQRTFEQHCVLCHGQDGTGAPDVMGQLAVDPPDLTDDEWTYGGSDAEIFAVIAEGTPNDMEAFSAKLSPRRIEHLVHYIRSLATEDAASEASVNPVPFSEESRTAGYQSYVRFCVECHGMDGRGHTEMVEFLLSKPADLTKPGWKYGTDDATVFNVIKNGTPNDMPGFADRFDDEAIWDIVNYLKSLRGEE